MVHYKMDSEEMVTMGGGDMDPRPTLDTTHLDSPATLLRKRKRLIRSVIKATTSKEDRRQSREVVAKYRRKQKRRLSGSSESDPDPYDETYVFYCVTT